MEPIIIVAEFDFATSRPGEPNVRATVVNIGGTEAEAKRMARKWLDKQDPNEEPCPSRIVYLKRDDRGRFFQFDKEEL